MGEGRLVPVQMIRITDKAENTLMAVHWAVEIVDVDRS